MLFIRGRVVKVVWCLIKEWKDRYYYIIKIYLVTVFYRCFVLIGFVCSVVFFVILKKNFYFKIRFNLCICDWIGIFIWVGCRVIGMVVFFMLVVISYCFVI